MMSLMEGKLVSLLNEHVFCDNCRSEIMECRVIPEEREVQIDNEKLTYIEKVAKCIICDDLLYVPKLETENNKSFQKAVLEMKKKNYTDNSILIKIDQILMKYKIGKKPLSLILGWGEATISRYYKDDTTISQPYRELLEVVLNNPKLYDEYLEKNRDLLTPVAYSKSKKAVNKILEISTLSIPKNKISSVYTYILMKTEDITPLAMQKLLYYAQAFNKIFNGKFLFEDDCEAWVHGPVYRKTYDEFKQFQYNPIEKNHYVNIYDRIEISFKEKEVLDSVINNLGCYSGKILEKITHMEQPWIETRGDLNENDYCEFIIEKELIHDYFCNVKDKYKLITPVDIADYSKELFDKIH